MSAEWNEHYELFLLEKEIFMPGFREGYLLKMVSPDPHSSAEQFNLFKKIETNFTELSRAGTEFLETRLKSDSFIGDLGWEGKFVADCILLFSNRDDKWELGYRSLSHYFTGAGVSFQNETPIDFQLYDAE